MNLLILHAWNCLLYVSFFALPLRLEDCRRGNVLDRVDCSVVMEVSWNNRLYLVGIYFVSLRELYKRDPGILVRLENGRAPGCPPGSIYSGPFVLQLPRDFVIAPELHDDCGLRWDWWDCDDCVSYVSERLDCWWGKVCCCVDVVS